MIKKLQILLFIALTGCSSGILDYETCPRVQIMREDAYLSQVVHSRETFQINLIGFDGYCYWDKKIKQNKALIKPIFQIKRLRPSDETEVHFSFYTETVKGPPEYLGKKTHFAVAPIPATALEIEYTAPQVLVYVPEEYKYSYDINMGLVITAEERKYNHRTFDVEYRYFNK